MADETIVNQEDETLDYELGAETEFEEISIDEVDRVVGALEQLIQSVDSENIQVYLEEAMNNIFFLVYEGEDGELAEAA